MKPESKREKFLSWVIDNSTKWWLWMPVLMAACALINIPIAGLGGLGLLLWGALTFAAGVNVALEAAVDKIMEKEKKNDTTH